MSWSRRFDSCDTAAATQPCPPGNMPMRSKASSDGTASAPMAARGIGMPSGTGRCGAPRSWARSASRPPADTASTRAPSLMASPTASRVSSVSPENETATTSVLSSTKFGTP